MSAPMSAQHRQQDADGLEQILGQAVLDSLDAAHLTVKEAAYLMGWNDTNFRHALRGDLRHHMSLTRLIRLPWVFWMCFLPTLTYLMAKKHVRDVAEDLSIRKRA